jgi:hypothetical protein
VLPELPDLPRGHIALLLVGLISRPRPWNRFSNAWEHANW